MSEERKLTFMGAINEAIDQSMEKDEDVILIGTDVSGGAKVDHIKDCLLYTSPSPRDKRQSRMPSSA